MYEVLAWLTVGWLAGNVLAAVIFFGNTWRIERKQQRELDEWIAHMDESWEAYVAAAQAVTDAQPEPVEFDETWHEHFWHEEHGYTQIGCKYCHRGYNVDVGRQ